MGTQSAGSFRSILNTDEIGSLGVVSPQKSPAWTIPGPSTWPSAVFNRSCSDLHSPFSSWSSLVSFVLSSVTAEMSVDALAARVCREALLDSRVFAVACQRLLGVIRAFCFKLVRNGENRIADPLQDDRV